MQTFKSARDVRDTLDSIESYLMIRRYFNQNPIEQSGLNQALDLVADATNSVEVDCPLELLSEPGNEHGAYESLVELERRLR